MISDPISAAARLGARRWRIVAAVLLVVASSLIAWRLIDADNEPVPVLNGSFGDGTLYWTTSERASVEFSTVVASGRAGQVAQLVPTADLPLMALEHRVRSVPDAELEQPYEVAALVRVQADARVALMVEEESDEQTRTQQAQFAAVGGRWQSVRLNVTPQLSDSSLTVSVGVVDARTDETFQVDDVRISGPSDAVRQGCGATDRGIPQCGAYLGGSVGLNADPNSFEESVGGRLAVRRTFYQADQVSSAVSEAQADLAQGRVPWVSFKFPHAWSDMVAGAGDEWAADIAERFADVDGPVWVAFHHEPETDGDIDLWRQTQERLAPIVRSRASNVAYSVILTGFHQVTDGQILGGDNPYSLETLWPDTEVDLLGIDTYNYYGVPGKSASTVADLSDEYFEAIGGWAEKQGIAWGVAETGYSELAFQADPDWLGQTFSDLQGNGGIAMAYFNSAPSSASGDWLIDTDPRRHAFAKVLAQTSRYDS